jgi:hypothetical protein
LDAPFVWYRRTCPADTSSLKERPPAVTPNPRQGKEVISTQSRTFLDASTVSIPFASLLDLFSSESAFLIILLELRKQKGLVIIPTFKPRNLFGVAMYLDSVN